MKKSLLIILLILLLIPISLIEFKYNPPPSIGNIGIKSDSRFAALVPYTGFSLVAPAFSAYTTDQDSAESDANPATENSFGDAIPVQGYYNVSISGTWVATVYLYRSANGGTNWYTVESYTANTEDINYEPRGDVIYRIGIPAGAYTSGTANCIISVPIPPVGL